MKLDKEFWEARYKKGTTGWDIGHISYPLKEYFDQLGNKELKILIPGAGNAYEAEYLFSYGFTNVHVIDISEGAIASFKKRVPDFPEQHLHCQDFFTLEDKFDLIIEQTFFCALDPSLRGALLAAVLLVFRFHYRTRKPIDPV